MRAASRWVAEGGSVCAVTRYPERCCELRASGIEPVVADIMVPETLKELPKADTVLFAVGYDRSSGHSIRQLYVDGLRNVLEHLSAEITRFIYVSSTGVYGQSGDAWVDEQSPCEPTREGGRACWQAEQLLLQRPVGPANDHFANGRHLRAGPYPASQGIAGGRTDRSTQRGLSELDPRRRCGQRRDRGGTAGCRCRPCTAFPTGIRWSEGSTSAN